MAVYNYLRMQEARHTWTLNGDTATTVHLVEIADLPSHPNTPEQRMDEALTAVGFSTGDSAVFGATTYIVQRITGRPVENGAAIQVNVEWRAEATGQARSWSGTLTTERTNLAIDPEDESQDKRIPIKTTHKMKPQTHQIDVLRPTMVFTRRFFVDADDLNGPPDISVVGPPNRFIARFLGKTNDAAWGADFDKHTVLITRMHVDSELTFGFYYIDIEFSYRPETWDVEVVHLGVDGRPVEYDTEDDQGQPLVNIPELQSYRLYKEDDFTVINPLP